MSNLIYSMLIQSIMKILKITISWVFICRRWPFFCHFCPSSIWNRCVKFVLL